MPWIPGLSLSSTLHKNRAPSTSPLPAHSSSFTCPLCTCCPLVEKVNASPLSSHRSPAPWDAELISAAGGWGAGGPARWAGFHLTSQRQGLPRAGNSAALMKNPLSRGPQAFQRAGGSEGAPPPGTPSACQGWGQQPRALPRRQGTATPGGQHRTQGSPWMLTTAPAEQHLRCMASLLSS